MEEEEHEEEEEEETTVVAVVAVAPHVSPRSYFYYVIFLHLHSEQRTAGRVRGRSRCK